MAWIQLCSLLQLSRQFRLQSSGHQPCLEPCLGAGSYISWLSGPLFFPIFSPRHGQP